ncbi:MAG: DNA repair exonuclease [Trueperaceae bacterium]|nr:DNA repair exonuclease [Trueperaceae bacterium]
MPRLLHLADLHLGWRPRDLDDARANSRRARRDALLEHAVDTALAEHVDAVVIAGDLFETFDPDGALVERTLLQLERLRDAGVHVVGVPGNHDELTYPTSVYRSLVERWPGLLVTSPTPTKVGTLDVHGEPLHVYGLAYVGGVTDVRTATRDLPAPAGDGTHIFVAHGTLMAPGVSSAASERSLPLDRDALAAAGYDYVALGHVHAPAIHRLGATLAVYPGCVGGKGLDDLGSRHWTIVDLERGSADVREVAAPVQPLRHVTLDVTAMAGRQAIDDAIASLADEAALVRVRLVGALPTTLDLAALTERARGDFFHLEIRDETTAVSEALLDAWAAVPTVRGSFVRRMRRRLDTAADDAERARITRALLHGIDALQERV